VFPFSPTPTIATLCAITSVKTVFCWRMSWNVGYENIRKLFGFFLSCE
jgi:hypothetical protein